MGILFVGSVADAPELYLEMAAGELIGLLPCRCGDEDIPLKGLCGSPDTEGCREQ
jgi:hypothetical protein